MPDVVDKATRSRMMSGIRSKNTKGELQLRKGLHARGFRFRLHASELPGRPDLVFPKYHAAIFVNGCFWHGHECSLFKWPKSRQEFWLAKITGNQERDRRVQAALRDMGWRVGVVWECSWKGKCRLSDSERLDRCCEWLRSSEPRIDLTEAHRPEVGSLTTSRL